MLYSENTLDLPGYRHTAYMQKDDITDPRSNWTALESIAFIGNYLPRQCGIATFTAHLLESVAANAPDKDCWVVAMDDPPNNYVYPPRVKCHINQNTLGEYVLAADRLNHAQVDVVCLQHEFGIFGGNRGGFILELLRDLKMPIVTTLHTILKEPSSQERHIITQLSELSDQLVVMSQRSKNFLLNVYNVPEEKVTFIHHGIPDIPLTETGSFKQKFGIPEKTVIMTFGLLSPDKGLETVIDALPQIIESCPDVIYMIVGATHPHHKAEHGEAYRTGLYLQAKKLGVEEHVIFYNRFVDEEELIEFIGAADIYVTPYLKEAQIASGTLAYALGMGKAVVSTPFWHAQELLAENRGRLFPFMDHAALASQVIDLLNHPEEVRRIRQSAYNYGRSMTWSHVGRRYLDVFAEARQKFMVNGHPRSTASGPRLQPLPEINLDHLIRMTDGVGVLQHAKYSIPDREHGYCVDDNARALIVAVMAHDLHPQNSYLTSLITIYLSFLDHAFNNNAGRFRNFMSYERLWLEEAGSEDSFGRALWSLGISVALGRNKGQAGLADDLFKQSLAAAEHVMSPRAAAFAILGIHAYLPSHKDNHQAERVCTVLSSRLLQWFRDTASEDWPWFENVLTYDNARLSQAMLLSGRVYADAEMLDTGLQSLAWLTRIQTDEAGQHFAAIGNHGWYPKGGDRARFDQQPIEAAAMVDACMEAFKCTKDERWIKHAYRCFNWYLGDNDLHESLYDHSTGGCRDGLGINSINENQGAESTLCWLASLLAIYHHRGKYGSIIPALSKCETQP